MNWLVVKKERIILSTFQLSLWSTTSQQDLFVKGQLPIVKFKQISKNDLKEFMVNHEYPLISFIAMENNLCKHGYGMVILDWVVESLPSGYLFSAIDNHHVSKR